MRSTQTFRICHWVEMSVVAEPCVAGRRGVLGAWLQAGVRWCGEGMRKRSACSQLTGYGQVSASKQKGKKNLNIAEVLFRAYCISVVHGAPWAEVRSFFFYLLFSDQT